MSERSRARRRGKVIASGGKPYPNSDEALPRARGEARALDITIVVHRSERLPEFRHWQFRRMGVLLTDYWPNTGRCRVRKDVWGVAASPLEALRAAASGRL